MSATTRPPATLAGVLIISPDATFVRAVSSALAEMMGPAAVAIQAGTLSEALAHLATTPFDAIALTPTGDASRDAEWLQALCEAAPDTPARRLAGVGADGNTAARALCNIINRRRMLRQLHSAGYALQTAERLLAEQERTDAAAPNAPALQKDLAEAIDRARRILGEILIVNRPADISSRPANLPVLMDETLRVLDQELRRKNITVVRDFAAVLPALLIDQAVMLQVFSMLVSRSIAATPPAGQLRLVISATRLAASSSGVGRRATDAFRLDQQALLVRIEDNGPAFPPDELTRLFDPPPGNPAAATGGDLAFCQSLVHEQGGNIRAENLPDGGARITVTFVA